MSDRHDLIASMAVGSGDAVVNRALKAIRAHLAMDVAYVSQFVGDNMVLRKVDAPGQEALAKAGDVHSLNDTYCRDILAGRLPELMADTALEPVAAAKPITQALPIGRHMSVPIRLEDGSVYGMFCCLGFTPDPSLRERDLQMMRAFADLAGYEISREVEAEKLQNETRSRVITAMSEDVFDIVYQPIVDAKEGRLIGFESLSRFRTGSPDVWFADAAGVGLGVELELAAIGKALGALALLPNSVYLAVNASPDTILSGQLNEILAGLPLDRIVLEVTEHSTVSDYDALSAALNAWRAQGVRLAVDDAGAGYSSLRHILALQPDLIKLDMSLTRNICLDPARKALAAALIGFARETGSHIIAEGVETEAELVTLRQLGVEKLQGYFLGRPMSLAASVRVCPTPAATRAI
ncbi:MAG: diguanylate phosphodiesterase [Proteobacteria bacterium HN_bin10]|nr:MAG: diguanylate phosphodiesterase [Proteobacteria bacterium HN_bin10]